MGANKNNIMYGLLAFVGIMFGFVYKNAPMYNNNV